MTGETNEQGDIRVEFRRLVNIRGLGLDRCRDSEDPTGSRWRSSLMGRGRDLLNA
jgi:hypothetical protein